MCIIDNSAYKFLQDYNLDYLTISLLHFEAAPTLQMQISSRLTLSAFNMDALRTSFFDCACSYS